MEKRFQLRRIGLPPSVEEIKNLYSINVDTTFIGRGKCVDIYLDSTIRKGLISRAHSHIIRDVTNGKLILRMYDTSLNGTYVNDVRIKDFVVLKEGDKIAFGHLRGAIIDPGECAPQKETEFLFKFEECIKEECIDIRDDKQPSTVFMSPQSLDSEEYLTCLPGLPGLHHQSICYETRELKEEKKWLKKPLCNKDFYDLNTKEDHDLESIVSSVTSKIFKEDNSENEFNLNISNNEFNLNIDNDSPFKHPMQRILSKVKKSEMSNSPFSSASSEYRIKCDTSLSTTHVYENVNTANVVDVVKSKVKKMLNDHDCGKTIEISSVSSDEIDTQKEDCIIEVVDNPIFNVDDIVKRKDESFFSDKSEEITDSESDSDSDFVPSSDSNSLSTTRTRKAPERFSPNRSTKKLKLNTPVSNTTKSTITTKMNFKKRKSFTHDQCAAWDCVKPSGAIKQITWVACDDCDAWYHVTCSSLSAKEAKRTGTNYHCGCG